MKFKLSTFKDKHIFLIGPVKTVPVTSDEYDGYDFVARMSGSLGSDQSVDRTDIIFLRRKLADYYSTHHDPLLNDMIIISHKIKEDCFASELMKQYPSARVASVRTCNKGANLKDGKMLYEGTHALALMLKYGASVTYGGSDFWYSGFGGNYIDGYVTDPNKVPTKKKRTGNKKESKYHDIKIDLRFIKNYLMPKYGDKLKLHGKTKYFFEKS